MSVTYSYIGKEPVYSKEYHCHIWPTPAAKATEVEIELPVVEKKERPPRPPLNRLILSYLSENGPATARIIGESVGCTPGAAAGVLRNNPNRFVKIGGQHYHIWGLPGHSLTDVKCEYRVPYRDRIIRYLKKMGEATSQEIANELRISRAVTMDTISENRDKFDVVRRVDNAVTWKLKGVVNG